MAENDRPVITTNTPKNVVYALVAMVVTLIIGVGFSIGYSAQAVHSSRVANDKAIERSAAVALRNQQQICGIIVILDNAYKATPPTTPLGKQLGEAIAAYRLVLGCDTIK